MNPIVAVVFDTDGVVTDTARVHMAAWKQLFDAYLIDRFGQDDFAEFTDKDYLTYVDGKPRYDGIESFLASRDIELPHGDPSDPPGSTTVCALGNSKDAYFTARLRADGARAFDSTVRFIRDLHAHGIRTAAISASRNCAEVLASAGVDQLFEVRVDGVDSQSLGLAGKPDPAIFLEAARQLGVDAGRVAVVEDAVAGVEAGRRGGFGLVVGIDRNGYRRELARFADLVVADLSELVVADDGTIEPAPATRHRIAELPSALDAGPIERLAASPTPVVLLDYDGTLTPIVARPELAVLDPATLSALVDLAGQCTVGVISGRDLDDVRSMVPAEGIWFAGSHGFDLLSPTGVRREIDRGRAILPALDRAQVALAERVASVPAAWVERKRFAIAVHYRQTPDGYVDVLREIMEDVAAGLDGLRVAGGKKIFELRPDIAWDKGAALDWVVRAAGLEGSHAMIAYLGDDETDEDAFAQLVARPDRDERGFGIVVGREDRDTAARFRLDDPAAVREFLVKLSRALRSTAP